MTLKRSDLQSDSDLDSIHNSRYVFSPPRSHFWQNFGGSSINSKTNTNMIIITGMAIGEHREQRVGTLVLRSFVSFHVCSMLRIRIAIGFRDCQNYVSSLLVLVTVVVIQISMININMFTIDIRIIIIQKSWWRFQ